MPEILEEVARLGAQLLMQAVLEAEVTEFLGRDRYARAVLTDDARPGSRNGYREVTVETTAGPVKPKCPLGCRPRSRTSTGRSSTPKTSRHRPAGSSVEIIDARLSEMAAKYAPA